MLALVLAACSSAPEESPAEQPAAEEQAAEEEAMEEEAMEEEAMEEEAMAEVDFAMPPGGFLERAVKGEFSGTTVTVDGPFTNPDGPILCGVDGRLRGGHRHHGQLHWRQGI